MSEKYDGIRAFWNGGQMYSRLGREIILPHNWRISLPLFALDGELWLVLSYIINYLTKK